MTPKDKAKELVDKFSVVGLQQRNEGIECALIAVDEIIKNSLECFESCFNHHRWRGFYDTKMSSMHISYWEQVKEEIEKL